MNNPTVDWYRYVKKKLYFIFSEDFIYEFLETKF